MGANFQKNQKGYGFFLVDLVRNDPCIVAAAVGQKAHLRSKRC